VWDISVFLFPKISIIISSTKTTNVFVLKSFVKFAICFQLQEANSFERDSESNLSIGSHNKTVLRVRPQPKSTAPSEEKDVRLQSVISRIERESTRSNFEETRNEDGDESRLKEAMSPSRIPDTPDQSMDTERTILRSNSSSGNISRRPAKRQGLGGSSRLMVRQTLGIILVFLYMKLIICIFISNWNTSFGDRYIRRFRTINDRIILNIILVSIS